jgi:acyl-homoserine-lactone acylase
MSRTVLRVAGAAVVAAAVLTPVTSSAATPGDHASVRHVNVVPACP